ncbi:SMI1/KNR4 family protein [Paenibacillus yanchengensis]|uniref:SMI1/KNR4 family protein n=1 Tax=Paenibacillus yanchengensis TaxID=2035833 RepID=A0ABW4YJ68_9BACL
MSTLESSTWKEILTIIRDISEPIYESIQQPATKIQLDELEEALQVALPISFKQYLTTFNGQSTHIPFMGYNYFLSCEQILQQTQFWRSAFTEEDRATWVKEDRIKPVLWAHNWIPITEFEAHSSIVLDLCPGRNGTVGQIFQYYPGMTYEHVTAVSFEQFSAGILQRLKQKQYTLEDEVISFDDYYII